MTTVKKAHWLRNILIVLVACGIAGLILAVIQFNRNPGRTYAYASLQFSFNGAGEGKAPNGYPFDVNDIYSGEVLSNALEATGLTGTYTTDQIRDNLTVSGVYPENIVKQMTAYTSLLDADAEQQAAMADYHATQYNVYLNHDFDPTISRDNLTALLNNILGAYRAYFTQTCTFSLTTTDAIADLPEYDYIQQLQAISESVNQQGRFAREMADRAPGFRMDRKGFDDIVVSYTNLESDISRLTASVTQNTVSKDRDRLQKQYEMELRTLNHELESTREEIVSIEDLIATYEKDGIVYVSTSGSLQKVSGNASDTYDKLVAKRQELMDSVAGINADIARYQTLLEDITKNQGSNKAAQTTAEQTTAGTKETEENTTSVELTKEEQSQLAAVTEKQIETLIAKKDKAASDFTAMLSAYAAQEINDRTVLAGTSGFKSPSLLSTEFLAQAVKTAGVFCVIGFMLCLVMMIVIRLKEEKMEQ